MAKVVDSIRKWRVASFKYTGLKLVGLGLAVSFGNTLRCTPIITNATHTQTVSINTEWLAWTF